MGISSFARSGGEVLSEAVTGGGFSISAEIASPEFDKWTEVSLRGGAVNAAAAMTALSPYKADFGTVMGLGDSAGREGAEEGGGGATD